MERIYSLGRLTALILGIFLFTGDIFSQAINADSLKNLLTRYPAVNAQNVERLHGLASYYWRIKPDSSIYYAEKALEMANSLQDKRLIGISQYLKGNVLLDRQENAAARQLYDEAIGLFRTVGDQQKLMQAIANYGVTYSNENNGAEARKWLNQALEMAKDQKDYKGQAYMISNLGILADNEGDKDKAIELYTQALKCYEQLGDWGRVAVVHHNIGALYSNLEDQSQAIEHTLQACRLYRQVKNLKSLNNGLLNLAYYYKEIDSLPQATRCITEAENTTFPFSNTQKALCFIIKAQLEEKQAHFQAAMPLLDSCLLYARLAGSAINLHNGQATLARILLTQKNYASALKNSLGALEIALQMNDAVSINLDQKFAAESYQGLGETAKALHYLSAYEAGRDTLYTQERFQAVQNVEKKYEAEKKELQIQLQHAEIVQQRFWLYAAAILIALLAALGFLLYKRNLQKKAINQFLGEQNEQLLTANSALNLELDQMAQSPQSSKDLGQLTVTLSNRDKTVLRLGDIIYIESKGNFVHLHTAEGKHLDWQQITHYEDLLGQTGLFCRTHRSYLVNALHIRGRRAYELLMSNGASVTISSTPATKANVHGWLDKWQSEGYSAS